MSDLIKALAFAYKRRGADVMERAKLLHMLTFDLRWFSPDRAKRVLGRAISAGLLQEEGENLRATFDIASVGIPVNFRPRDDIDNEELPLDVPKAAPAPAPPHAPPAPPQVPTIDPEIERERARRGQLVNPDVAALIVQRRRGEDVRAQARALSPPR